jgi:hypothetical protein
MFFIVGLLYYSNTVFAQPSINLSINPPVEYLHVKPGEMVEYTVTLKNSGGAPITLLPMVVDFTTDGKTGRAIPTEFLSFPYISLENNSQVYDNEQLNPKSQENILGITISPRGSADVLVKIEVPEMAEEKEYPLTILFFADQRASMIISQAESKVTGAIGSNLVVLVSKTGIFEKKLEIIEVNTKKIIDSFSSISFTPLVKNNSIGSIVALGNVKIIDFFGQEVAEFEIHPDVVLGNSTRELRAISFLDEEGNYEIRNFEFKPKFLLGPYKIVINLVNEDGELTSYTEIVYSLPILIIIAIILSSIIVWHYLIGQISNKKTLL